MIILVEELENQVTIKTSCHNDLHAIISLTKFDNPILNFTAISRPSRKDDWSLATKAKSQYSGRLEELSHK